MALLACAPRRALVALVFACALLAPQLGAQDAPIAVQVPLLVKVLAFDRLAQARSTDRGAIGVLYQGRNRGSVLARDEVIDALHELRLPDGSPVRCVAIDLDGERDLAAALARSGVGALYVTPLRAVEIATVAAASRKASVTTLTGSRRYVEEGLAVGIGLRGDRPRILINLEASKLEGAEFTAHLLGMAEVMR